MKAPIPAPTDTAQRKTLRASLAALIACSLALAGCRQRETPVRVERLDQTLAAYSHLDHLQQMDVADSLHAEISAMFAVLGTPTVTTGDLARWSQGEVVRVFQPAVDSVYPSATELGRQIGRIQSNADKEGLALPPLTYVAVTWGSARPIVRVDSIVLIALNHFLGSDYPGYAQWQEYRRAEKTPAQLPYSIAGVLAATQYPMQQPDTPTLLSWMLYEGALAEARMRLVPGATAEMALGYTSEQLKALRRQLPQIWEEMALRKAIYSTDPLTIDRYIAPAPASPALQGQAPGRVGRYIGWCIARAYLKTHPGTTLADLLSPQYYNGTQTLITSGFDGKAPR